MKITILTILLMFLTACATKKTSKEISMELTDISYKYYDGIKEYGHEIIDNHEEYTADQKNKLKKILDKGLDKNRELKAKESKLSQLLLRSLLAEKTDLKKINALKAKVKKVYDQKYEAFLESANEMKVVLGITPNNERIIDELNRFIHLR